MVSEGLAGQFVRRVLGSEPELWERALAPEELLSSPVEFQLLEATYYDHSEWFFGTGTRPRWLGYTLGYQMVEAWLATLGEVHAATWVNVPAQDILANAAKEGLVA